MRYMPAKNPAVTTWTANAVAEIGRQLRNRRQALGVSAVTTAEAAGMSRITLHRIEAGSPAVTMGAYLNAAAALGLELALAQSHRPDDAPARPAGPSQTAPDLAVRVGDFPQLRMIGWQLRDDTELSGVEALALYERNWRHVDHAAMTDGERAFLQRLADTYSRGILLV